MKGQPALPGPFYAWICSCSWFYCSPWGKQLLEAKTADTDCRHPKLLAVANLLVVDLWFTLSFWTNALKGNNAVAAVV